MPSYEEPHRRLGSDREETARTPVRGGKRALHGLAALVVAVVVVGGAAAFVKSRPGRVIANQPSYLTAALGRGAIEESVVVSGIVRASGGVVVAGKRPGRVREALVADNSEVKKGQALAIVDVTETGGSERSARSYVIVSPIDGIVTSSVSVGQTIGTANDAAPELVVAPLTNLEIVAPIDELDAVRIHEGQAARCQFTEPDGPELPGKVLLVNRSPRVNRGIVTFDAIIGVNDGSRTLYPGTKSTIRIITGRRQNVWRIPQSALRVRLPSAPSSSSRDSVYRLGESGPQSVDIKVGMRDESYVELLDGGLEAKDVVITGLVRRAVD